MSRTTDEEPTIPMPPGGQTPGPKKYVTSAEEILSAPSVRYGEVYVKEWDRAGDGTEGWVAIRSITSRQHAELQRRMEIKKKQGGQNAEGVFREMICMMGVIDPDTKKPVLESKHLERLRDQGTGAIQTVTQGILALSGITDDDVDELVGNSSGATSSSSSTS